MSDEATEGPDETVAAPRRSRMALVASLVVAVVVAGFVGVLATREPATDREANTDLEGRAAPALVGKTLDGGDFDIDEQHGRWVIVNFFATWCRACVIEHPELDAFQQEHEEIGDATVVSVVYDDDPDDAVEFFEQRGGDWPVVLDATGIAADYGVVKVPETYLVDPNGRVVKKLIGGVTQDGIEGYMEAWAEVAAP